MKRLLLLIFLLFLSLSVHAQIITGEVEFNADIARGEVFSKPIEKISFDRIRNRFYDSDNIENLNYLFQGITELKDRKLAKYSWYYSSSGKLINFTQKDSVSYPCRITKYKPDGSVTNMGYRVSDKESFLFSPNGKLLAHWLGNNCYDEYNHIIMTRKIMQ